MAIAPGGGLYIPPSPSVSDVICLSNCSELRTVAPGGTIQVTGQHLETAEDVSFKADDGRVKAPVKITSDSTLTAKVPDDAVSGRIRVVGSVAAASSPVSLEVDDSIEIGKGGAVKLTAAQTGPERAYQYGNKKPTIDFITTGGGSSNNLRVDVTDEDGQIVRSYNEESVKAGTTESVTWNGRTESGKAAPNGDYRFVVRSIDGSRAKVTSSVRRAKKDGVNPFRFSIYGYKFPVRGPHTYGDGLGAGRGHQGQDVLAKCGLKLVAARAGTVYFNDTDGRAGNYIVINTKGTGGGSNTYMHLMHPSSLKVGDKVKTGQVIGLVGDTGDATTCHLHFEQWSAPGWYQGGSVTDPTPELKKWDSYS